MPWVADEGRAAAARPNQANSYFCRRESAASGQGQPQGRGRQGDAMRRNTLSLGLASRSLPTGTAVSM